MFARVSSMMVKPVLCVGILTVAVSATASLANAQTRESSESAFSWSGAIGGGHTVFIKNINGPIRVEHSPNNTVEITAEKRWRRGNPNDVRIVQPNSNSGDILVCALWKANSTCDEDGIHSPRNNGRRNDRDSDNHNEVSVAFVLRIPDGVRVDISTVNGGLEVSGVTAEVVANTVNGQVTARSAGGPVHAKTVNGSIDISMGAVRSNETLDYETVNGSVTVALPSDVGAELDLSTVNGRVSTDFPVSVSGTISPRRLRGTVGNGAMRLRASTVNGSVTLRRN